MINSRTEVKQIYMQCLYLGALNRAYYFKAKEIWVSV